MDFTVDYFGPLLTQLEAAVTEVLPLVIPVLVIIIIVNFATRWVRGTIGG